MGNTTCGVGEISPCTPLLGGWYGAEAVVVGTAGATPAGGMVDCVGAPGGWSGAASIGFGVGDGGGKWKA